MELLGGVGFIAFLTFLLFFFFNDTATTEIYTLSLHDALPIYACDQCGREDSHWGRRCAPCVLTERLTALLSQPGAGIHPRLQPIFDVLVCGPRPQTTLYWLDHSTGPGTLA